MPRSTFLRRYKAIPHYYNDAELSDSISSLSWRRLLATVCGVTLDCSSDASVAPVDKTVAAGDEHSRR